MIMRLNMWQKFRKRQIYKHGLLIACCLNATLARAQMDHSSHEHDSEKQDMEKLQDHNAHDSEKHDMGKMQGGTIPSDARNPHAYSDGYTLTRGPFAQPGPRLLKLADEHAFWSVQGDRLEYHKESEEIIYDFQAWYGRTYNRVVIKSEGDMKEGDLKESSTDLLWSRALTAYFDTQLGVRIDRDDEANSRGWIALGLQGLASYWFELDLTAYLGEKGQTALSAELEYETLLTQRLIFQSRSELSIYGKDDRENGVGSGFSDIKFGLRLRYEFSRQFAPYIGVEWSQYFGDTADYREAGGDGSSERQVFAGLRFWF